MMGTMANLPRPAALLVAISAAGLLAAACTSGSGSGAPASTPAVPSMTADPLDMTKAAGQPCGLLRADQLAQYHLVTPGTPAGTDCVWTPTAAALPGYRAGVDQTSGGLAGLYGKRARMPVFQPTKVGDYPAVNTASSAAAQRQGQCTVEVGVAADTLIIATVTVPPADTVDYSDPCPDADQFAESIVANAEGAVP